MNTLETQYSFLKDVLMSHYMNLSFLLFEMNFLNGTLCISFISLNSVKFSLDIKENSGCRNPQMNICSPGNEMIWEIPEYVGNQMLQRASTNPKTKMTLCINNRC